MRRWQLTGLISGAVVILFGAGLAGVAVLGLLAAVAAGVLVALRRQVGRREVGWALLLGVLAGAAGALEEGADLGEVLTGLLQLPLTMVTLLAGWALARQAGWVRAGIGPSLALTAGPARALRVAGLAFVFALPWALSNIVNGPLEEDQVTSGWQVVAAAVRPGIAEEAWGRVFLIAALYVLFRRAARADTALLSAALISTLWFAFIHAPANPVGALALALLYGLPITWLFLRRGLEAAIGFHVSIDLVRFGAAYLSSTGVWGSSDPGQEDFPMTASRQVHQLTVATAGATVQAGQPVEVTVRFVADRPTDVMGGRVELLRHGAVAHFERGWMGAGATVSFRRSAVLDRADLDPAGPLVAGQHLVRQVTLTVPAGEATVAGYLVQQGYAVRGRLHLPHGSDAEASTAVLVTSRATDRSWVADTAAVVDDADVAAIGIEELSSRQLFGGVPISGTVTVAPRRAGRARGLRVELVLVEQVPARVAEVPLEEDRAKTTVVTTVELAGPVDLEPGRVLRLPFTIRPPLPLRAPSISAPEFTLRWLLRAVLDRPRRADPTATLKLWAATAP